MDRALIKKTIDEWQMVQERIRGSSTPRDGEISAPTKKFAKAIVGVRRSGKTTRAIQMFKDLNVDRVFYYNFEDPLFYPNGNVHDIDSLISVAEEYSSTPKEVLILDEIQNVDGWERWVRKAVDQQHYKIVVTGSSAKLLSRELASAVSGRALEHTLWPLSFKEFLLFQKRSPRNEEEHLAALRHYLTWGAFPEVVLASETERSDILRQYLTDIVLKDVITRNEIRNKRALDQITAYYFTDLSSLHSYSAIKNAFSIGIDTAASYTAALSEAFLIFEMERYHRNLKIQTRDPKKIYIIDSGLRKIGARSAEEDTGKLLENAVYLELRRKDKKVMYFKGEQEVDFVILRDYTPEKVIQVCASDLRDKKTYIREVKGLLECLDSTQLDSGVIVTWNREEKIREGGKHIEFIPAYKWLLRDS
jgi:predicted AAA+ superfamily ATPase